MAQALLEGSKDATLTRGVYCANSLSNSPTRPRHSHIGNHQSRADRTRAGTRSYYRGPSGLTTAFARALKPFTEVVSGLTPVYATSLGL